MFEAFVLKVLISPPGDTDDEVAAVKESLHGWNGSRAETEQVILLPRHWKSDAVPRLGAAREVHSLLRFRSSIVDVDCVRIAAQA